MRSYLDCYPCFLRQALEAARLSINNETLHAVAMNQVMKILPRLDRSLPPPLIAVFVYNIVKEVTACSDPYEKIKQRSNEIALNLLPWAESLVQKSSSPLDTALRLACAGNVVDFGTGMKFDLEEALREVTKNGFHIDESALFWEALDKAETFLYLGDNAGEIVFDRLLLRTIRAKKSGMRCYFAVRGGPVINDITLMDARRINMHEYAEVISTGCAAPGVPLSLCSDRFLRIYRSADLILSKGQGNYESLSAERERPIFFLLRAKCKVAARHLRAPVGAFVFMSSASNRINSTRRTPHSNKPINRKGKHP
jgi:uncharacterized protein with ATP-grasp and redox domains